MSPITLSLDPSGEGAGNYLFMEGMTALELFHLSLTPAVHSASSVN